MNTAFLLVLLTVGDAGHVSAAFVNTGSLFTCQTKSKMLGAVISTSGTKILANSCFVSELDFSKFSHNQEDKAVSYNYVVSLSDEKVEVIQSKNKMECIVKKENIGLQNKGEVYCTTSTQQIIRDEKND